MNSKKPEPGDVVVLLKQHGASCMGAKGTVDMFGTSDKNVMVLVGTILNCIPISKLRKTTWTTVENIQ